MAYIGAEAIIGGAIIDEAPIEAIIGGAIWPGPGPAWFPQDDQETWTTSMAELRTP